MFKVVATLAAIVAANPGIAEPVATVTFKTTAAMVPNPERGFYVASKANLDELDRDFLERSFAEGYRLVYVRIDLSPYRASALPPAFLSKLDQSVEAARSAGVKLIVRAVYNYPAGETAYRQAQDAPLPIVLGHIKALEPLFQRNEDVIAFVQAGFVGAWGEWHTSSNGLTEPAARQRIRDALLDAVPRSRFVQFRYPPYLEAWTPELPALGAAFSGALRTGFHNDCFLASETDVGTFDPSPQKRAIQRAYAEKLGKFAPFGGETCNPADDVGARPRSDCADIQREGASFHLTYLNDGYYRPLFHQRWIAQGCASEVSNRMGYRVRLVEVAHPTHATAGGALRWRGLVTNDGWARIYNPRPVEMLLRNRSSGEVLRLVTAGVDPRSWLPGKKASIDGEVRLPTAMSRGIYDVLIALPDPMPRLHTDPRYSIKFANQEDGGRRQVWDAKLGAFSTGTAVEVEP